MNGKNGFATFLVMIAMLSWLSDGAPVMGQCVEAGCATTIDPPGPCAETTDCQCNDHNNKCKKYQQGYYVSDDVAGDEWKICATESTCHAIYRRQSRDPTGLCYEDADCMRVIGEETFVSEYLVDEYEFLMPMENCIDT